VFLSFSLSGTPETLLVVAKHIDNYKHSTTTAFAKKKKDFACVTAALPEFFF